MKKIIQFLIIQITIFSISTSIQAKDNNIPVKDFCIQAEEIGKEGTQIAFEKLVKMYPNSKGKENVKCVVEQMALINQEAAVDLLFKNLENNDGNTTQKAIYGLSLIKNKRIVELLHIVLQGPDSRKKCNSAYALGVIKNPGSQEFLTSELESKTPATRKCMVKALRLYNDPINCQKIYDIWMYDSDEYVRWEAGIATIIGNCENKITRTTEHNIDIKSCDETQVIINTIKDAIIKYPLQKEWVKKIDLGINKNDIDHNTTDEGEIMKMNLIMASVDWGESVDDFYSVKDWGNLKINKKHYMGNILQYRKKEESIKLLCPNMKFPDFIFWNQVIQDTGKQKSSNNKMYPTG